MGSPKQYELVTCPFFFDISEVHRHDKMDHPLLAMSARLGLCAETVPSWAVPVLNSALGIDPGGAVTQCMHGLSYCMAPLLNIHISTNKNVPAAERRTYLANGSPYTIGSWADLTLKCGSI